MTPRRHKITGDGHGNTIYNRQQVQGWRDMMRPPLRMKLKEVAEIAKTTPQVVAKKLQEYGI